jgi:GxxExxY protein
MQQVPVFVRTDDGTEVGACFADLVVNDVLIVELKAVQELADEHWAQLIQCLKDTRYELGLLVNFGSSRLQFSRIVYTHVGV